MPISGLDILKVICHPTHIMPTQNLVQLDHTIPFDKRLEEGADSFIQKKDNINQVKILGGPWRYAIWQTFMRAHWQQRDETKFKHLSNLRASLKGEANLKQKKKLRRQFLYKTCIGLWNPFAWLQALTCYLYTRQTIKNDSELWLWFYSMLHPVASGLNSAASLMFAIPFAMLALPVTLMGAVLWNFARWCTGAPTDWQEDFYTAFHKSFALFNPLNHYFNRIGQAFYDIITEPLMVLKTLVKITIIILCIYYLPHLLFNMENTNGLGFHNASHDITNALNYFVKSVTWFASFLINDVALAMVNWLPQINWSIGKGAAKAIGLTTLFTPLCLSFVGWVCDLAYGSDEPNEVLDNNAKEDPSLQFAIRVAPTPRRIIRPDVNANEDASPAVRSSPPQQQSSPPTGPSRPNPG